MLSSFRGSAMLARRAPSRGLATAAYMRTKENFESVLDRLAEHRATAVLRTCKAKLDSRQKPAPNGTRARQIVPLSPSSLFSGRPNLQQPRLWMLRWLEASRCYLRGHTQGPRESWPVQRPCCYPLLSPPSCAWPAQLVEFTLTTPGCLDLVSDFRATKSDKCVVPQPTPKASPSFSCGTCAARRRAMIGCGTVMDIPDAKAALDAGARAPGVGPCNECKCNTQCVCASDHVRMRGDGRRGGPSMQKLVGEG